MAFAPTAYTLIRSVLVLVIAFAKSMIGGLVAHLRSIKNVRKTVARIEGLRSYTSRVNTLEKLDCCRLLKLRFCWGHSCDTRDEQKGCEESREHGEVGFGVDYAVCGRRYVHDRPVSGQGGHIYTACFTLLWSGLSTLGRHGVCV